MKLPYSVRLAQIKAASAAALEAIEHLRFADLSGSETQAAWAAGIRARLVVYLQATLPPAEFDEAVAFLRTITNARDFIDLRTAPLSDLLGELRKIKARRAAEAESARQAAHPGARWAKVRVNLGAVKSSTPTSLLLRMPQHSQFVGWFAWIPKKAVIDGDGFEIVLRFPTDKLFKLVKYDSLRWRGKTEKRLVRFDEFTQAFGGNFELLPEASV